MPIHRPPPFPAGGARAAGGAADDDAADVGAVLPPLPPLDAPVPLFSCERLKISAQCRACVGLDSDPFIMKSILARMFITGTTVCLTLGRLFFVCRYYKIREAAERIGVPVKLGWLCVDIGSSPGYASSLHQFRV